MTDSHHDSDWRLRTFRPGDEPGIAELFERGFGRRVDERVWRWKFQASPEGNVWLAVDAERPVFHYGGMPRQLAVGAETRPVIVTVDAVTDPRFRRRGLFSAAMGASHRVWTEAGLACVLGLPNDRWGSRVEAFDWRPLVPLEWQIRPLRPERLLAKRLRLPALSRLAFLGRLWNRLWDRRADPAIEVREAERADDGLERLWRECRPEVGLVRDREWLEWRYFSCPLHRYRALNAYRKDRLVGYLIYRFDEEHRYGFVADLLTRPEAGGVRRALVAAALDRLRRLGADAVAALAVPESVPHRTFRRAGFLLSWGAFTVHCVPLADDLPLSHMRDPRRWWMCGGDFDVV